MLTLKQFQALAESYGADLGRWPRSVREESEALLRESSLARATLSEALALDEAIKLAGDQETAALWKPGAQDAALARLRAGVAARIAPASRSQQASPEVTDSPPAFILTPLDWLRIAVTGGVAIAVGLFIGAAYVPAPETANVLTMLQPAPLQILAD